MAETKTTGAGISIKHKTLPADRATRSRVISQIKKDLEKQFKQQQGSISAKFDQAATAAGQFVDEYVKVTAHITTDTHLNIG